jgi:hypothetical protein
MPFRTVYGTILALAHSDFISATYIGRSPLPIFLQESDMSPQDRGWDGEVQCQ